MTLVVYVKEGCPYCQKVLLTLEENPNQNVEVYVADKDFKRSEFKSKYGEDATFPRGYLVNGKKIKLVGGSDKIIDFLQKH